jgi:uncharacterized membrane protein YesL
MFFIIKKLFEKNDFNIKKEFTYLFKREFKKSNQLFYPFILCSLILIVDINFISWVHFAYSNLLVILFKILLFLLVMIFLYSLVVYINTTVGKKEIVKKSFMILLNNPMTNIYILTGLLLLYILTLKVVGIFYIFSGSVFTLFLLITVLKTVKKNIFESH